MKKPWRILFLGIVNIIIVAIAIMMISLSNRKYELLDKMLSREGMLDYSTLKNYINPANSDDPLLVSTIGTIVFDPSMKDDMKISTVKNASFTDSFIKNILTSTIYTNSDKVNIIQNYLLAKKINTKVSN